MAQQQRMSAPQYILVFWVSSFLLAVWKESSLAFPRLLQRTLHRPTLAQLPRRVNDCGLIFVSPLSHLDVVKRLIVKALSRLMGKCQRFVRSEDVGQNE